MIQVTFLERIVDNLTKKYGLYAFIGYLLVIWILYRPKASAVTAPTVRNLRGIFEGPLSIVTTITLLLVQLLGKICTFFAFIIFCLILSFYRDPTGLFEGYFTEIPVANKNKSPAERAEAWWALNIYGKMPFVFSSILRIFWVFLLRPIVFLIHTFIISVCRKLPCVFNPSEVIVSLEELDNIFGIKFGSPQHEVHLPGGSNDFLRENAPSALFPLQYYGWNYSVFYTFEFVCLLTAWIMISNKRKNDKLKKEDAENSMQPHYYTIMLVLVFSCVIPIITKCLTNATSPMLPIFAIVMSAFLVMSFVFVHIHENLLIKHKSDRPAETTEEKQLKYNFDSIVIFSTVTLFFFNFFLFGEQKQFYLLLVGMTIFSLFTASAFYFSIRIKNCIENRVE